MLRAFSVTHVPHIQVHDICGYGNDRNGKKTAGFGIKPRKSSEKNSQFSKRRATTSQSFLRAAEGAQRESAVTISISVCAVASMLRKALPIDPMMHCHGLDRRQCIRQERLLGAQGCARSLEGREGSKAGSDGQGRQGGVILSSGSSKSDPCRMRRRPSHLTSPSSVHRERITLAELRFAETMRLISVTLSAMGSGFQPSVLSGY